MDTLVEKIAPEFYTAFLMEYMFKKKKKQMSQNFIGESRLGHILQCELTFNERVEIRYFFLVSGSWAHAIYTPISWVTHLNLTANCLLLYLVPLNYNLVQRALHIQQSWQKSTTGHIVAGRLFSCTLFSRVPRKPLLLQYIYNILFLLLWAPFCPCICHSYSITLFSKQTSPFTMYFYLCRSVFGHFNTFRSVSEWVIWMYILTASANCSCLCCLHMQQLNSRSRVVENNQYHCCLSTFSLKQTDLQNSDQSDNTLQMVLFIIKCNITAWEALLVLWFTCRLD